MGEGEPPSVSRGALSTSESSGPDSRPPNMTLWTPHCHILFENLSGFPAVGGGWGPFRSPHRSLGEGEHVSQLGAQTCLSSQSWARGGRPDGRTDGVPSVPFSVSLPPPPISPPSGFSFLLCSFPALLFPSSWWLSLPPHAALSVSSLRPFPPTATSPALGRPAPCGDLWGRTFWGPVNSSSGIYRPSFPTPPEKHLKLLMKYISVLSERLRRGLILGDIKVRLPTFISFGYHI